MFDSIGTSQIIDIAIAGAVILLGAAGFWRGVVKEVFISASLLLAYIVTLEWAPEWGKWIGEQTSFSVAEGQYAAIVATLAVLTVILGYVGCTIAGLPPADLPGRFGGLLLGVVNAVLAITILVARARQLVLDGSQRETLSETRIAQWLAANPDWVVLSISACAFIIVIGGLVNRRRRLAVIAGAGPPPGGASGFKIRRSSPLAPEAEKIDRSPDREDSSRLGSWPVAPELVDTVPLTRVGDPSRRTDRSYTPESTRYGLGAEGATSSRAEVIRCVSCGERITEKDRYCPRCGRLLISG
jgi:hypothetical protein